MSSIDVVIPCYRYGRYLRECVESVLSQNIEQLRVLIIDDASPDETPEIATALVREDKRVTYVRHSVNVGHIHTYNEGLAWVSADYMLLLSADDYLLPGALTRAMKLMDDNPTMGLCFGEAVAFYDDGGYETMPVSIPAAPNTEKVLSSLVFIEHCIEMGSRNIVPTPTAIVRNSVLQRLGYYRFDLPHSADFEMWLRLAAHGPVGFIKSNQAVYRRHDGNMSLGYMNEQILMDLKQRKAAFDVFLESNQCAFSGTVQLHANLLKHLAEDAVSIASMAFNERREVLCLEILEYALAIDPAVKYTIAWASLRCKMMLGVSLSNVIRRWLNTARRVITPQ